MKRIWYVPVSAAIVLLLAAVLAGCGDSGAAGSGGGNAPAGSAQPSAQAQQVDACSIVTQQDASKIMGQQANKDESGNIVIDPNMLGECEWSYDLPLGSELIQFRIWNGEQYYGPAPDATSLDVGDKGAIKVDKFAGVDMEWLQGGKVYNLSYFSTGPDAPDATAKVEEMKALAKQVSGKV